MKPHPTKSKPRIAPYLAPRPPAPVDAEWAKRAASHIVTPLDVWHDEPDRLKVLAWVEAIILRHAPDHSALLAEVGRLTKERDERWTELDCSYVNMVQKLSSLVRSILVSYERGASQDVWPKVEEMRDWMELKHPYVADLKRLVADHENRIAQLATLRRERDEARQDLEEKCAENDRERAAHLQAYEAVTKERDEALVRLGAWHKTFGTTQLTHAEAELVEARKDRERLDWLIVNEGIIKQSWAHGATCDLYYVYDGADNRLSDGFIDPRAALDAAINHKSP